MPLPEPKTDEKEDEFVSRCVSVLAKDEPDMSNNQRLAICFSLFKKSKAGEKMENKKKDEKGRIIIAENVKLTLSGSFGNMEIAEDLQIVRPN